MRLPSIGPVVAVVRSANYASGRHFGERDSVGCGPTANAPVPFECTLIAGFFVGPEAEGADRRPQRFEDVWHLPAAHDQRLASFGEAGAELDESFSNERPVARMVVIARCDGWLGYVEGQNGAPFGGGRKRAVIPDAQVSLVPDDLRTRRHG